jgi:hypothetical protein
MGHVEYPYEVNPGAQVGQTVRDGELAQVLVGEKHSEGGKGARLGRVVGAHVDTRLVQKQPREQAGEQADAAGHEEAQLQTDIDQQRPTQGAQDESEPEDGREIGEVVRHRFVFDVCDVGDDRVAHGHRGVAQAGQHAHREDGEDAGEGAQNEQFQGHDAQGHEQDVLPPIAVR